jgi:hypothetical protein
MKMPGFTAEESMYKTSRHYRTRATFNQAGVPIHPALGEVEDGPIGAGGGYWWCVDKCIGGCKGDPACEKKCHSKCVGAGGTGTSTEFTCGVFSGRWWSCNIGIPAWEWACKAEAGSLAFLCSLAADKMREDSHCEVC